MSVGDAPVAGREGGIDAFISYRRSDGTQAARRIRAMLQNYRLPRPLRAGHRSRLTIFLDTVYERGAADFYEQTIRPALLAARWLVIVATPDAVRRTTGEDWISREVADFSSGPNAGNVVVVRALGEFMDELPADIAERYPNVQIVDLRDEGLLSRLSPQRNARLADEQLKLVGPLFDVKLEDMPRLRREEEKRQMGRLGALAGVAVATLVLVAGLSVFALRSQWEGNQALSESLKSARGAIVQIVAQLSENEPLDSPIHEAVLEACDVSARLAALSRASPDPDASLACELEEERAIALAGNGAAARERIAAALEREDARGVAGGDDAFRTPDLVRTGYRFWAALSERDAVRDGIAYGRWAAFERRRTAALAPDPESSEAIQEEALRFAIVSNRTAWTAGRAGAAELGSSDAARAAYVEAAGDAERGFALLAAFAAVTTDNSDVAGGWLRNAERAVVSATDIASFYQQGDAQAVAAYRDILPHFALTSEPLGGLVGLRTFRASALSGALLVGPEPTAANALPGDLWECLTLSQAALAELPEDDPDSEFLRTYAVDASDGCYALSNNAIDLLRAEVDSLHDAGKTAEAADKLDSLMAAHRRLVELHTPVVPWDRLYAIPALRDLAALRQELADIEAAEDARIAALGIIKPYLADLNDLDLTASRAAEVNRAWDGILTDHYDKYIDVLRNAAATQPPAEAIATLRKVIDRDTAWDAQMVALTQWDRVWRAGVMLELADRLAASDPSGRSTLMAEAYDLVAPLGGKFDLEDTRIAQADAIWSRLVAWKEQPA